MRETSNPFRPKTRRVPRSLKILGYLIKIREVSARELATIAKDDRPLDGFWDDSDLTIYILKSLSARGKRQVLFHELGHVIVDLKDFDL